MKVIARYRDPYGAHIARSQLEAAGIDAYVFDDQTVGVNWLYSGPLGGVRLAVADEDESAALEFLAVPVQAAESGDTCSVCGSLDIRTSRYSIWSLVPALFFGAPLFFPRRSWQCGSCGHRWGREDEAASA